MSSFPIEIDPHSEPSHPVTAEFPAFAAATEPTADDTQVTVHETETVDEFLTGVELAMPVEKPANEPEQQLVTVDHAFAEPVGTGLFSDETPVADRSIHEPIDDPTFNPLRAIESERPVREHGVRADEPQATSTGDRKAEHGSVAMQSVSIEERQHAGMPSAPQLAPGRQEPVQNREPFMLIQETEQHAELDGCDAETGDAEELNGEDESGEEGAFERGFGRLGLSPRLLAAIEASGYTTPTPIQAQTIPCLLEGRDVLGQAQTGTGKTAAFALPLLERLDLSLVRPQVLVLTPTRELAMQVAASFEKYAGKRSGFRVASIYGGQDYTVQFRQLDRGVHVVVGTPGRVMDHMRRGTLNLEDLRCLVLDEADEMLRMGFAEDVEWVLTQAPADRQMALFSATLPEPIRRIAQRHLKDPVEITIGQRTATAETVEQRYVVVAPHQKEAALARVLEAEPTDGVLVFVRMRATTEPLAAYLAAAGFKTAALNGDLAQKQRTKLVEGLKSGEIDILVATDVAARGLDVQRVSHVINYDLPIDTEAYIHRIGRTGRAGRNGVAILFLHPRERSRLRRLEQVTRQTITPMPFPTNRMINKQRVTRFHERITKGLSHADLATFQAVIEHYQRENEVPLDLIAASLAALAHGETPLLMKEDFKAAAFEEEPRWKSREGRGGKGGRDTRREREPRDSRSERGAHGAKPARFASDDRAFRARPDESEMETFRLEVGRAHQVQPGNIVGAIANEAQISSELIGKIKIFDQFSTVDLPTSLAPKILAALRDAVIAGRKLRLAPLNDRRPAASRYTSKPAYPPQKQRPHSQPPFNRPGPKSKKRAR